MGETQMRDLDQRRFPGREAVAGRLWCVFLILSAVALYLLIYVPSRHQRSQMEEQVKHARQRISRLYARVERLRTMRNELAFKTPEAIEAAVRNTLRRGRPGDYIIADPLQQEKPTRP